MKFKVYNESEREGPTVTLRLRKHGSEVYLEAVDDDGCSLEDCCLLAIQSDGRFRRCRSVNEALGLPLTEDGRVEFDVEA